MYSIIFDILILRCCHFQVNGKTKWVGFNVKLPFAMIQRSTTADKYRKLYSTKQWRNLRGTILTRDYYRCQRCGVSLTNGKSQPTSAVLHHKKPHKGDLTF